MTKKMFLGLIVLLIGMLLLVCTHAEESGTCGIGLTWTLDDEGTLTISGSGHMTESPWTYDNIIRQSVKRTVINNGVKSISNCAFSGCVNMETVTIPDSVFRIGGEAFYSCSSLKSVTIPYGVSSLDDKTFFYCSSLTNLAIPGSVTSIGKQVFSGCSSLVSLIIPEGVTSIGEWAFSDCSNLMSVTIPNSVTSIGEFAFYKCSSLKSITIPSGVTTIERETFNGCSSLSSVIIPSSVYEIKKRAFQDNSSLTDVTIPGSVSEEAFSGCIGLVNVTFLQGAEYIDNLAFEDCYDLTSLKIPTSLRLFKGGKIFNNCWRLSNISVPANNYGAIQWFKDFGFEKAMNIQLIQLSDCIVIPPKEQIYTGNRIEPEIKVKDPSYYTYDEDYLTLTLGEDYSVSYINNINAGTATATVTGNGNYTGTATTTFTIKCVKISDCLVDSIKDQVYSGKAIKPGITITLNDVKLKKDKDYKLSYKNNKKIGTATVTITGKGNFTGTKKVSFLINPKPVTLSSLISEGGTALSVMWKKGSGIDGYEIEYSLNKETDGAKKMTVSKASSTSTVIRNLQYGKTYYVRIRTFKKAGGKKYYSEWSKTKSAKIK